MKKLVFIMDDFGVHESVSYLVRDILRNKIQKMHDDWVEKNIGKTEDLELQIAQISAKALMFEQDAKRYEKLFKESVEIDKKFAQQGGADDSGRVTSPTESIVGMRDIPDQN